MMTTDGLLATAEFPPRMTVSAAAGALARLGQRRPARLNREVLG